MLECILARQVATGLVVTRTTENEHHMEGILGNCHGSTHMGVSWQCQKILFNCDNLTVVDIWAKGSTESPEVMAFMALVRLLYFCAVCYNINVSVQHISGTENKIAELFLISRIFASGN